MRVIRSAAFVAGVCLFSSCAGMAARAPAPAVYGPVFAPGEDVTVRGNCIAARIEASADPLRTQVGETKRSLVRGGGVATAIGTISAALMGAFKPEDTKIGIGLGGTILGAGAGLYQVWKGAQSDAGDYVSAAGEAVARYNTSMITAADEAAKRAAVAKLYDDSSELKRKYPQYANFSMDPGACPA
jgi:hypothetical protein